jgi:hypothetical protein
VQHDEQQRRRRILYLYTELTKALSTRPFLFCQPDVKRPASTALSRETRASIPYEVVALSIDEKLWGRGARHPA